MSHQTNAPHPIDRAASALGSQAKLAKFLGVSRSAVNQWKAADRQVPIKHCIPIERATGGAVSRQDLRPEDWQEIWPQSEPATSVQV